jgi:hypothetical protein
MKGDVVLKNVARLECKATEKKSFSVTREMVDKLENACIGHGEIPAIIVEFMKTESDSKRELAVIPMWALEQLLEI